MSDEKKWNVIWIGIKFKGKMKINFIYNFI